MSLGEHFREFRRRLLICAIAIVIGGFWGWSIYDSTIVPWFEAPLAYVRSEHHYANAGVLNYSANGVSEAFGIKLKIALWFGVLVASPIWLWQIWAFLAPGLTRKEKRTGVLFLAVAVPLFALGCWAANLGLPNAVDFLLGATPDTPGSANLTDAQKYVSFVTKFILVFGLAFLLPVFLVGLNMVRVLPGQVMLKGWRVAVMLIAVFCAVMCPAPDAWSMLALMIPMIMLYFIAAGISVLLDKRREKERPAWLDVPDDQTSAV
ncbi:twin-arginine translocase subunit TatC [Calidifontibacter sp. DB0510]|uniref:Sec-independent protein translocase protein TatC n=2 Tax=Metallococcus carri TaxID=1656884 RepID=A0A967E9F1_9MICO|nr:twin-arginine translocase subunit TatC [Metallococcus carri]NOP37144.1 twin-arginine translocase subunit TatC [Calidifontibacter sp. DB2511S]